MADPKKAKEEVVRIGYWKIRGLVSPIHYICEYLSVPYERVDYEQGDDLSREVWLSVKHSLGLDFPNLPYLIHGNVKLTESLAILRYICSTYGPELLGNNPRDAAVAEMIYGVVHDIKNPITSICYGSGDRAAAAKLVLERMPKVATFMKDRKFVVGDYPTFVDFYLFEQEELFDWISEGKLFQEMPVLKEHHDRVAALPKFAKFLNSPRFMARPYNNKSAMLNN